jgi:hypothetical protein
MPEYKIQSILFNKEIFNLRQSIEWLLRHQQKINKYHETDKYYRYRQLNPKTLKDHGFEHYKNIKLKDKVVIICVYK